jgi:hypothetical protein
VRGFIRRIERLEQKRREKQRQPVLVREVVFDMPEEVPGEPPYITARKKLLFYDFEEPPPEV